MFNGIIYPYGISTMPSSALGISRSRMVRFEGLKHLAERSFTWQGHFAVQLPWCPGLPWKQLPRCHTAAAPQQTVLFSRPDPDLPLTVPRLLTFKEMRRVQGASLKKRCMSIFSCLYWRVFNWRVFIDEACRIAPEGKNMHLNLTRDALAASCAPYLLILSLQLTCIFMFWQQFESTTNSLRD